VRLDASQVPRRKRDFLKLDADFAEFSIKPSRIVIDVSRLERMTDLAWRRALSDRMPPYARVVGNGVSEVSRRPEHNEGCGRGPMAEPGQAQNFANSMLS
jgi:hypothetical protein